MSPLQIQRWNQITKRRRVEDIIVETTNIIDFSELDTEADKSSIKMMETICIIMSFTYSQINACNFLINIHYIINNITTCCAKYMFKHICTYSTCILQHYVHMHMCVDKLNINIYIKSSYICTYI